MRTWIAGLSFLAAAACGHPDFEPPDRGEQVLVAEALYSPALFDSIAWADERERARAGNEVFASKCRNCHGTVGEGGTAYAGARGLSVPSLVAPDWPLASSLDSVRHRIFVGHHLGMPTWGVAGITPREIDGAAFYVLERLRPEMLGR
jgi:mono/diheme cytochrome c family protein